MITVIIVDDEPLARQELARLIRLEKDFEIVGEAESGDTALELVQKIKPDLLFLDIEMPGLSGLEVASKLSEWENPPRVVFATAYHQYAVEAFEANAIDYILKPFEPLRIKKALDRVRKTVSKSDSSRQNLVSLQDHFIQKGILKKLTGHERNRKDRIVIDPSEVYFFSADAEEVVAHLGQQDLIIGASLKDVLSQLDPEKFSQTHKSYIVNLDKVQKVSPMFSGNYEITLKPPHTSKVPISRRFASGIKKLLGLW
jgi:two-component system, LytTR family, response regulator LytT